MAADDGRLTAELAAIKERERKATRGPWKVDPERARAHSAQLQADRDRLYAEISELDDAIDERRREALEIERKLELIREALTGKAADDG